VSEHDPSIAVRRARANDLADVERLARLAAAERLEQRGGALLAKLEPSPALDVSEIERDQACVVVGLYEGVLSGFAHASRQLVSGSATATLFDLYVEPGLREVGLGEALFDAVLEWARANRCQGIDARVLPGARAAKNFFERYGMVARLLTVHREL
jgi:GNAT superfamily N-acetyltransferase